MNKEVLNHTTQHKEGSKMTASKLFTASVLIIALLFPAKSQAGLKDAQQREAQAMQVARNNLEVATTRGKFIDEKIYLSNRGLEIERELIQLAKQGKDTSKDYALLDELYSIKQRILDICETTKQYCDSSDTITIKSIGEILDKSNYLPKENRNGGKTK